MSGGYSIQTSSNDLAKYTPITLNASTTFTNSTTTLLNITGKGYIKKVAVWHNDSYTCYLKITVDGSILYYAVLGNSTNSCVITSNLIENNGIVPVVIVNSTTATPTYYASTLSNICSTIPYTSGGNYFMLLPKEYYFNSTLKIEITNATSNSTTILSSILGGVM